jgi:hypothetical protein
MIGNKHKCFWVGCGLPHRDTLIMEPFGATSRMLPVFKSMVGQGPTLQFKEFSLLKTLLLI